MTAIPLESAIWEHLTENVALAAVIGTSVFPLQLPLGIAPPAITYQRISTQTLQHRGNALPTYSRPRFQFTAWAESYDGALELRSLLRAAMSTLPSFATDLRIDAALLQDDRDAIEAQPGRWNTSTDYYIWHKEGG